MTPLLPEFPTSGAWQGKRKKELSPRVNSDYQLGEKQLDKALLQLRGSTPEDGAATSPCSPQIPAVEWGSQPCLAWGVSFQCLESPLGGCSESPIYRKPIGERGLLSGMSKIIRPIPELHGCRSRNPLPPPAPAPPSHRGEGIVPMGSHSTPECPVWR